MANVPTGPLIPPIPVQPGSPLNDLITTLNDRIRRINQALVPAGGDTSQVATIVRASSVAMPKSLGKTDAGLLWHVTDYAHLLMWTGSGWEFCDGGGNFFAFHKTAPDGTGWQLCDGTSTDYLHIANGALSKTSFTTPNLTGSPAYFKPGTYTGTIIAATPPGMGAPNTTAAIGTGAANAAGSGHTHTITLPADPIANIIALPYFRR